MANTVHNLAVISNPRTGSKSLSAHFATLTGKTVGHIHQSPYLKNSTLCTEEILSDNFVLHGHWHTLDRLGISALEHIYNNYEIHTIVRNRVHSFASAMVLIANSDVVDLEFVDAFVDMELKSNTEILNWDNIIVHDFDELYNNKSHDNYMKNVKQIKNWNEILDYYARLAAVNAS